MITFTHRSLETTDNKIVKDIDINDEWKIESCTFDDTIYLKPGLEFIENELAITNTFRIILLYKKTNKTVDLYALNILYLDPITKAFKHQTIRYYTMHDTKMFKMKENVLLSEHLKTSLINNSLDSLFPRIILK